MNIISVDNNWNPKVLRIELSLGNVCNYRCWYCFPGSNEGNFKFPNLEILKKNIPHLIDYYKKNLGKEIFEFEFVGGEPTHWPKLLEFIKFLKENFKCLITITTNGSKSVKWWNEAAEYFDRVMLSCHYQYVNIQEFRDIADLLYSKGIIVSSSVMMDPNEWEKCIELVQFLKGSRYRWTIKYANIVGHDVLYHDKQRKILNKFRARRANLFWFWKNNNYYVSKVKVTDEHGKSYRLKDNEIIFKNLNRFNGWKCNIGVDWIVVKMDGTISGNCNQNLFGLPKNYNFFSDSFIHEFSPKLISSVCDKFECNCTLESNMKKVIPIYENRP
jgi:MoaA/NifB/PqqE/SkfB family radical SAM enzyme